MPRKAPEPGDPHYRPAGGAGWGGPAKGAGTEFAADNQPSVDAKLAGKAAKAAMRDYLETERMNLARELVSLATTAESEMVRKSAIEAVFDRLDGKPVQAVSGPDGEALPQHIAVSFVKPE